MTRSALAGTVLLTAIAGSVIAAPLLSPNPPSRQHADHAYAPPMRPRIFHEGRLSRPFVYPLILADRLERRFTLDTREPVPIAFFAGGRVATVPGRTWLPLGADPLGRDVLARTLDGGRRSLLVAVTAVFVTLALGGLAGALAGHLEGTPDRIIMGVSDFVVVLPALYAVVTLRAALPLVLEQRTIFWAMVAVLSLATWPLPARGVRAIVAIERRKGYAEAAYAAGAGPVRILLRHVLPAARSHLAIQGLLIFPAFIFAEASLSYLGLGFAEPSSSWGVMLLAAGRISAIAEAPWLLAPGLAIVVTVLAIHLLTGESVTSVVRVPELNTTGTRSLPPPTGPSSYVVET